MLILIVADVPRLNKSHYILLPYLALNQQAGNLSTFYIQLFPGILMPWPSWLNIYQIPSNTLSIFTL